MAILIILNNILIMKNDPSKPVKVVVAFIYFIIGLVSAVQFTLVLPGSFLVFTSITMAMDVIKY